MNLATRDLLGRSGQVTLTLAIQGTDSPKTMLPLQRGDGQISYSRRS